MAPAPSASAFPLHPNSCLLDEHDRMLFQHSHPTGTDAERTTLQEGVEGFSAAISKAIQPQSHALHLDQRAGTLPTHHRSNERVPGSSSQATKAAEDQPKYYKELTVRCTSAVESLFDRKHVGIVRGSANESHHGVIRIVRMVQQNVAMADFFKDVARLSVQLQLTRLEGLELQIRALRLVVEMKESRQVDRPLGAIDLPVFQLEVAAPAVHHFRIGIGPDFQTDRKSTRLN